MGHCHAWDKLSVFEKLPGHELAKIRTFLIHVIHMPTLIIDKPLCKKKKKFLRLKYNGICTVMRGTFLIDENDKYNFEASQKVSEYL